MILAHVRTLTRDHSIICAPFLTCENRRACIILMNNKLVNKSNGAVRVGMD